MYKQRVFESLLSDFSTGSTKLRSGAFRVYYLNFSNTPSLDQDRDALKVKAVDMSEVDDDLVTNLHSLSGITMKGLVWRNDMEYLITFPIRGRKSGHAQPYPLPSGWSDSLKEKEKLFADVGQYYYSLFYHSFTPTITDYGNFVFSYGISIVKGAPSYLREFDNFICTQTLWGHKDDLLRGISL
jgi:hypothetical protein